MARLIIGHVTDSSAKVWVRGTAEYPFAFVTVNGPGAPKPERVTLEKRHFYTGVADIPGLKAHAEYECMVRFGPDQTTKPVRRIDFGHCSGRFRTFPKPGQGIGLTFLLGSCNLHSLGPSDRAFERLAEMADDSHADFMIHCGDQIYYDVPSWAKRPDIDEYREKYLDAWRDSRVTRKFLTQLPHYMILDDHEMVDNFTNDMDASRYRATPRQIRDTSLMVYREFVHVRQPNTFGRQALYYSFSYGDYQFFVMDTRTERWSKRADVAGEPRSCMIGESQMREFQDWLKRHPKMVKFVVSSVPFVVEVDSDDKWNAAPYQRQRERIIEFLHENQIEGLIFLTGDMHTSYHGTLEIGSGTNKITVHELMSSPINQVGKQSIDRYCRRVERTSRDKKVRYRSMLEASSFYGEHSNAMVLTAKKRKIKWKIFRTKKKKEVRRRTFTV